MENETREHSYELRLRKTRLKDILAIHPNLRSIHEYLGLSAKNQIPLIQEKSAVTNPNILLTHLNLHPPVIMPIENEKYGAITKTHLIYLSRINMPESTRIPTLATDRLLSQDEIGQIIALETLGEPIFHNVLEKPNLWEIKEKLEQNGTLSLLGLSGHTKRAWARWLGIDPRALKN